MTNTTPAKFTKLVTLLKELFQLDQPDLDFGIYRIMHAKAGEVSEFLERELLPQVKDAFASYQPADKAALQTELAKAIEQAQALGADPETLPKVKELRQRIASESVDIGALENETYDHLFSFFRRYYSEGDFLAKRVYKPGVYAIPYEGEEVTLHWANKDQYYIKTSEYLRDYAFRLKPEAAEGQDPMRVRFKLVDASEGEHGNVKAAEGQNRVFVLAANDCAAVENGALELRFEYRPATLNDWPEAERAGKKKPPTQNDLTAHAVARILGSPFVDGPKPFVVSLSNHERAQAESFLTELAKPHTKTDGEQADYSRLQAHLNRYTARNTFDYFIHKDLGTFLRRELDFYIKNEVMHLDDMESETAPKVEQYLSKIKVIRRIAGKIIDFLAQLENFQKKLWLKKKFVVGSEWLVALSQIPDELLPAVCANAAQLAEWKALHSLHELPVDVTLPAYSEPLTAAYLRAHPSLMVDTKHFDEAFTARLLEAVGELDAKADGVLVHSENFQALSLMQIATNERVKAAYLDPPYNTGSDGFPYKDAYQHSSWMSMMRDRIRLVRETLSRSGAAFVSIDENEIRQLHGVLADEFGSQNFLTDIVWQGSSKNDQRYFSISHEYMLVVLRDKEYLDQSGTRWLERKEGLDDIYSAFRKIKAEFPDDFERQSAALKQWYADLKPNHPARAQAHFNRVEKRGIYFSADISKPAKGYYYDVFHPKTGRPCAKPKGGWRFIEPTMQEQLKLDNIHFGADETTVPCRKSFLHETEFMSPRTVIYQDGRAATGVVRDLFGNKDVFTNPKDHNVLAKLLRLIVGDGETALDAFAGSASTAHAVVSLNREDGARRKFFLVEMSDYFDTVLLARIKKVTFTPDWKDGKPKRPATTEEAERSPRLIKVLRLESYEDTLNNLALSRSTQQQAALDFAPAQGANGLREQYLLRYQLDVESSGSASLLNITAFADPTAYTLRVKTPGSDESREVNVDLLETFNWLLGLTVQHIAAPRRFAAQFERDSEGRLRIKGRLKQSKSGPHPSPLPQAGEGAKSGPSALLQAGEGEQPQAGEGEKLWWFRTVTGITPEGRKTLVIWRKLTGNAEQDNLLLDTWFRDKQAFSVKDAEFDLIYVNGDNTLENLRLPDETWKVRLTEEDFQRLMFEGTEA